MTSVEKFDLSARSAIEIGIPVADMGSMKQFYCDGLGFKPAGYAETHAAHIQSLRFGGCLLKLTSFADVERRPKPRQPDPSDFYITVRVSDLDQTVSRCLALGTSLLMPITSIETKDLRTIRLAFVADPMGNRIELIEGNVWSD